jgi:hypothetical protein
MLKNTQRKARRIRKLITLKTAHLLKLMMMSQVKTCSLTNRTRIKRSWIASNMLRRNSTPRCQLQSSSKAMVIRQSNTIPISMLYKPKLTHSISKIWISLRDLVYAISKTKNVEMAFPRIMTLRKTIQRRNPKKKMSRRTTQPKMSQRKKQPSQKKAIS